MNSSHSAFTIIELVFVIVILGILGAVAVPKLMAIRKDAHLVTVAQSLSDALVEISTYATSKGETKQKLSDMSDALKYLIDNGDATENLSGRAIVVHVDDISDCVTLKVSSSGLEENLTVIHGNANGNQLCINLQGMTKDNNYNLQLRGASIVR